MKYNKTKYPNIYWYETTKGKRYYIRRGYFIDGVKKEKTKSNIKSLQEARQALAEIETKIENNEYDPRQNITVEKYWEIYSNNRIETGRWSPDTAWQKDSVYRNIFRKRYGNVPINSLKRDEYELYINNLLKEKTKHTVTQSHAVFNAMINDAKRNKYIKDNPIDGIYIGNSDLPTRDKSLSLTDFKAWDETAREMLSDYQYAMVRLTFLGLRSSEVNGIRLSNLNKRSDDRYLLQLSESRTRQRNNGGRMKTKSSERYVVADYETSELLTKAIAKSHEIANKNSRILNPSDFLFLKQKTGKPIPISYLPHLFRRISKRVGKNVSPHMMRHFYATQGQIAGVSIEHMASALGHSTSYMTQKYTHIKDEVSASVTDLFIKAIQ